MAAEAGIEIEFIRKRNFRKEDRVKEILANAGSSRDWSASSRRWSPARPTSHGTTSRPARRIWCRMTANACITTSTSWTKNWACAMCGCRPGCRAGLQICFNGHNWLAGQLSKLGIDYRMADNAFGAYRGLATGTARLQRLGSQTHARAAGRVGQAVLPDLSGLRHRIPLEPGSVRICHRHRFPQAGGSSGHL